jgi:hypothetical protein
VLGQLGHDAGFVVGGEGGRFEDGDELCVFLEDGEEIV